MEQTGRTANIVLMAIVFEGGIGVLGMLLGHWNGVPARSLFEWTAAGLGLGIAATLPPLALLGLSMRFPRGPLVELRRLVTRIVFELFEGCRLWQLAVVSLAAGFGEEMLFRGFLQTVAVEQFGLPAGLIAASLLFGLAHPLSRTYVVVAAVIGAYLGLTFWATQNLLVPSVAHALYDFVALALILSGKRPEALDPSEEVAD